MSIQTGAPEMAREINRVVILDLIRKQAPISRAQIAKHLHLSKVTVSAIVAQLIELRLVIEIGEGASKKKGGRKPILLTLDTSNHFVLGVDIGYKNTTIAIGNLHGELLKKLRVQTAPRHSVEHIATQVAMLVHFMLEETQIPREKFCGLGVSVAGTVDFSKGLILFSPDFKWRQVPIAEILAEKIQMPTIAENCTRVMTRGEIWYGQARETRNLFYINVGYGIGSAMVVNDRIYDRHCECGHTLVTTRPIRCECGKTGCLEAVASGRAIERLARETLAPASSADMSAKHLAELARQGNNAARRIFAEAGRYLGRMTSIVANLFDPETIIIGGGVALAEDLLFETIQREFDACTMDSIKEHTQIAFSVLGLDAGVFGTIALALNHFVFHQELITRS